MSTSDMAGANYNIKQDLVIQEVENELFIFDGETSILHTLNHTAADIFHLLKKQVALTRISPYLVQKYNISSSLAKKHINEFIKQLEKENLLVQTSEK